MLKSNGFSLECCENTNDALLQSGGYYEKVKKALLRSNTFDESDGVLLQNKLVKYFWKDPLLLVAGLVGLAWGVSWFGASPLAQGLLCQSQNGALIECGFPQLLCRLPARPSWPREGVVAPKRACRALLEGEVA